MQYADVVAAMFDPSTADHPLPKAVTSAAPARRLRDAYEPVSMHAVWSPLVHERLAAQGLDFFGTYVAGRASVLGQPSGAIVAAAFAAFEPGMIGGIWEQAVQTVDPATARAMTFGTTAESLRSVLSGAGADEAEVGQVADQLAAAVDQLDPTGRPLFAGVQSLPWSGDAYGRLWEATLALREHRGDAHVAAYISEGLDPVRMNVLTELWLDYPLGEYSGTRAWSEEATAAAIASLQADGLLDESNTITAAGTARRNAIEERTDLMQAGVVDALGNDFDPIVDSLAAWSTACIQANAFPPDPRKRAAG